MGKYKRSWPARDRWRLVTQLMARDGSNCTICGKPLDRTVRDFNHQSYITFDHIIPRSAGGDDTYMNKRLAHQLCNNLRGNDPIAPEDENPST